MEHIAGKYNLKDAHEKQRALEEAGAYLRSIPSALAYSYVEMLAQLLNVKPQHITLGAKKPQKKEFGSGEFEDMLELSIVKTLLTYPNLIDTALDIINVSMFKTHGGELSCVLENQKDDPKLMRLLIRNDVQVYEEESFTDILIPILRTFYKERLDKIKRLDFDFEKKSFLIRKVKNIIDKLNKGELVPYESFGAF